MIGNPTADIDRFKARLSERAAYLNRKLHQIEDSLDQEPPKDVEDRASEREDDEVKEGLGNAGLRELQQIEAALHRIENGTFGICATCGDTISDERLSVVPQTALCRDCA